MLLVCSAKTASNDKKQLYYQIRLTFVLLIPLMFTEFLELAIHMLVHLVKEPVSKRIRRAARHIRSRSPEHHVT